MLSTRSTNGVYWENLYCNAIRRVKSVLWVFGSWVIKEANWQSRLCTLPRATAVQRTQEVIHHIAKGGKGRRGREQYAGWGEMQYALGTTAERSTYRSGVVHSMYCCCLEQKRDFPCKAYSKNTQPLTRIAVVLSNLCHAYDLHSELLRSAFLVLSIDLHTTSSTSCRRLRTMGFTFPLCANFFIKS